MPVLNGTQFGLFERTQLVGYSTGCTLSLSQDLPEKTTKDSDGWVELMPGLRSAEITVTGLVSYDADLNFEQLANRIITKQKITYIFRYGNHYFWGYGFVQDAEEITNQDETVSFTVTIKLLRNLYYGLYTDQLPWDLIFTPWEDMLVQWESA